MSESQHKLFVQLNDDTAFDLFLRTPEELISSVTVGAEYLTDESHMANQFVMAASLLVDSTVGKGIAWMYSNPILFLYRHALELSLKAIVRPPKPNHDLKSLSHLLREKVVQLYGISIEGWITDTLDEFSAIDPTSSAFRYVFTPRGERAFDTEYEADLRIIKNRLDAVFLFLWIVYMAAEKERRNPQPEP